jgi:uncharacterized membrane protein
MGRIIEWISSTRQFMIYWFQESYKEAVRLATTGWGIVAIVATLLYTLLTNIVSVVALLLSTVNGLVTGQWNYAPPAAISYILSVANTFTPLEEMMSMAIAYGTLKGGLALYRWVKSYFFTASSV